MFYLGSPSVWIFIDALLQVKKRLMQRKMRYSISVQDMYATRAGCLGGGTVAAENCCEAGRR